jgi:hypothetical protein
MPRIDTIPVLWADENEDLIDKTVAPRDCECVECGPSAAVYARATPEAWLDWKCASCGYTPESVDGVA